MPDVLHRAAVLLLLVAALGALLLGAGVHVATWWLARSGPESTNGEPWSFRGNGAIVVPFGMAPAILAGTWTALALRARSASHWWPLGLAAGGVGVGLLLVGMLAIVLFGVAGIVLSGWLLVASLLWMVVAPLLGATLPVRKEARPTPHWGVYLLAGVLAAVLLVVGFVQAERVLPPGS
jgi:hypothetical protein